MPIPYKSMTSPSVKATEVVKQPPAAKPSRNRGLPDDDPKPKVNASYRKVPICFSISGIASLEM